MRTKMGTAVLEFCLCIAAVITLLQGTGEKRISLHATICIKLTSIRECVCVYVL